MGPQINTPSPTPGTPTQAPTPVSPSNYCCSFDYKNCASSEYCNSSSESCAGCNGLWIIDSPKQCTALWQQCNDASSDCCGPASCTSGGGSYYQCQPGGPAPVPITPAPVPITPAPISPPVSTPTIPPISTPFKEPTPYPTHKAPTPYPIKSCSLKDESCERNTDCCKKKCDKTLKTCKK